MHWWPGGDHGRGVESRTKSVKMLNAKEKAEPESAERSSQTAASGAQGTRILAHYLSPSALPRPVKAGLENSR